MVDFILFTAVFFAIFVLANGIQKQFKTKPLQPIRIETEEEIRQKRLLQLQKKRKN